MEKGDQKILKKILPIEKRDLCIKELKEQEKKAQNKEMNLLILALNLNILETDCEGNHKINLKTKQKTRSFT